MLPILRNKKSPLLAEARRKLEAGETLSKEEVEAVQRDDLRVKKEEAAKRLFEDLVGDDYRDNRIGRSLAMARNITDAYDNFVSSTQKQMFDSIFGVSRKVKEGLKEGTLRKSTLAERIFTGRAYTDVEKEDEEDEAPPKTKKRRREEEYEDLLTSDDTEVGPKAPEDLPSFDPNQEHQRSEDETVPIPVESVLGPDFRDGIEDGIREAIAGLSPEDAERAIDAIRRIDFEGLLGPNSMIVDQLGRVSFNVKQVEDAVLKLVQQSDGERHEDIFKRKTTGQRIDVQRPDKKKGLTERISSLLPSMGVGIMPSLSTLKGAAGLTAKIAGIAGSIAWLAVDGVEGYLKSQDWGVSGLAGVVGGVLGGSGDGLLSIFANMGKWALAGATIGSVVPVVGTLAGGLAGAALGGLLGWIGGENIAKGVQGLGDYLDGLLDTATTESRRILSGLATTSMQWIGAAATTASGLASSAAEWSSQTARAVADFAAKGASAAAEAVSSAYEVAKVATASAVEWVRTSVQSIVDSISQAFSIEGIRAALSSLGASVRDALSSAASSIASSLRESLTPSWMKTAQSSESAGGRVGSTLGTILTSREQDVLQRTLTESTDVFSTIKRVESTISSAPNREKFERTEDLSRRQRDLEESKTQAPMVNAPVTSVNSSRTTNVIGLGARPMNDDPTHARGLIGIRAGAALR